MSPKGQIRGGKVVASSNLYTVILGLAFFVALSTAAFVAYTCYSKYGTVFKIP